MVVGVLFAAVIVAYLQVVVIVGVVFGPVADLQVVGVLFAAVIVADLQVVVIVGMVVGLAADL